MPGSVKLYRDGSDLKYRYDDSTETVSGGGSLDINGLDSVTPASDDEIVLADQSDSWNLKKCTIDDLSSTPGSHASSHENGGGDEISVAGLSGVLADDQHVIDSEVEAVITAELADGESIDNAIDTLISTHASNADAHHNESHTIASHSDTTATGAELDELTDGSVTTLHSHSGGSVPPWAQYTKSSSDNQDVGGGNGDIVYWTWDGEDYEDSSYFTHTLGSALITVLEEGWYHIRFCGNVQQQGGARTTLEGVFRVNSGTAQAKGTRKNYSRGANYGNISPGIDCRVYLEANDVVEVGTRVEDSDDNSAPYYVMNTNGAEIGDDENLLLLEYIGT